MPGLLFFQQVADFGQQLYVGGWSRRSRGRFGLFFPVESVDQLDEQEKYYIRFYAENGYQLRNVSLGGQGENRSSGSIGDRKQPRTYSEGIQQGKKSLAKQLSAIAEKHLTIAVKPEKQGNKVSERQRDKFMELISVENYEEPGKEMANERK